MLKITKVAWIRDAGYPIGQPAPGHFNCPCGNTVTGLKYDHTENVSCSKCGREFTSRGWIVKD